jgi:hypothetical protein
MQKQNLTRAHRELFRRGADEQFDSLATLSAFCRQKKESSKDRWIPPADLAVEANENGRLVLSAGNDGAFLMNDWSFGQICRLAGVGKETVNRLSPDTARQVFAETLPGGTKPVQLFVEDRSLRSLHGTSYTRLFDADLVALLQEFAVDFQPPQKAAGGGTGLYAGEQDLFAFLIDPAGWAEIEGEAFAPGFFLWNSEVGKRSLGIQSFWFQAVCQNHIVWDAVEIVDFSRKHTASVHDSLSEIRRIIEALVQKRDERRDGFVKVIAKAMHTQLGDNAEEVLEAVAKQGVSRAAIKEALEIAKLQGRFTIFALVDALTRVSAKTDFAGDRADADQRAAKLLDLVEA